MIIAIVAFVVVLGILVFAHEAGHFFAARKSGMAVEEFGFGFPPRIIGIRKSEGKWRFVSRRRAGAEEEQTPDTIYSLNWIPLGGFVRIRGENGDAVGDPDSFSAKPRWKRAIVLVAGVVMNFVLAFVLFTIVFSIGAREIIDDLPPSATVRQVQTMVLGVMADGPASVAGITTGDVISRMDGQEFVDSDATSAYIQEHLGEPIAVVVRRGNSEE
ncbi:MAG: site-2 protease family protein, partial [Candidatus Uhrbacteria bacterium]